MKINNIQVVSLRSDLGLATIQHLFSRSSVLLASTLLFVSPGAWPQQVLQENQPFSSAIIRERGQPIIPTYEGWFANDDGSYTLCYGYFNMNTKQSLEIPLGDSNWMEGLEDGVTAALPPPTHFDPTPLAYRRKFCVFTVDVPADFGRQKRVTWHLDSAGQTFTAKGHLLPPFILDEPEALGRKTIAPLITISKGEEPKRGRSGVHAKTKISAKVGQPVALKLEAIDHEREKVWVGWSKYSGPGEVVFLQNEFTYTTEEVVSNSAEATFSEPGEYVVYAQAIHSIADFEFFCCHTNAYLSVTVSP